jgi:DNA-binding transcriptional MerR regulator
MPSLIFHVLGWPTLAIALLVWGFAPGAVLRLIVLAYPRDDPRRRELLGELYAVPRIERPFWVFEQVELGLFEGLRNRAAHRKAHGRGVTRGRGAAIERAAEQGLAFGGDLSAHPENVGYRGPTACAAAGITYRQLEYWARTGLVEPSALAANAPGRLYSFRDILMLRVIKRLRDTGVSLQQIRPAVSHLRARSIVDLAGLVLMGDGISVYECTTRGERWWACWLAARTYSGSPSAGSGRRSIARSWSCPANTPPPALERPVPGERPPAGGHTGPVAAPGVQAQPPRPEAPPDPAPAADADLDSWREAG